jgi:Flp pilus assembly protein TadD
LRLPGLIGLIARFIILALVVVATPEPRPLVAPQAVARGDAALQRGQVKQAITEYRAALEAQPGNSMIIERLADSTLAAHRPDLSIAFLRQRAALHGWTPALHRKMADALVALGDMQQAVLYWRSSLTNTKADIPTLRSLIDYAETTRDWAMSGDMLARLISIDPGDERALYQLGLLTIPTDPMHGLTYLNRAAADPQYRSAATALGNALAARGNEPPSAKSFQIALTLMSLKAWPYAEHALTVSLDQGASAPVTLAFLGVAQDQQGRNGWPLIDRAFLAAPGDPMVNYAVALHWRLAGDPIKALEALNRAGPLDPRNPAIAAEIGLAYQMQGHFSEAALWFKTATALAPHNPGFRTLLATFYADSGYDLYGEGLAALRKLAELGPDDTDVRASLGWALFTTGQFDAARVELEKALTLDPTNPRARYYFGAFLEYRGDKDGAGDAYWYVYRDAGANNFRELAAGALKRLGYAVDLNNAKQ